VKGLGRLRSLAPVCAKTSRAIIPGNVPAASGTRDQDDRVLREDRSASGKRQKRRPRRDSRYRHRPFESPGVGIDGI
jgi:hypothetical protein